MLDSLGVLERHPTAGVPHPLGAVHQWLKVGEDEGVGE